MQQINLKNSLTLFLLTESKLTKKLQQLEAGVFVNLDSVEF